MYKQSCEGLYRQQERHGGHEKKKKALTEADDQLVGAILQKDVGAVGALRAAGAGLAAHFDGATEFCGHPGHASVAVLRGRREEAGQEKKSNNPSLIDTRGYSAGQVFRRRLCLVPSGRWC